MEDTDPKASNYKTSFKDHRASKPAKDIQRDKLSLSIYAAIPDPSMMKAYDRRQQSFSQDLKKMTQSSFFYQGD